MSARQEKRSYLRSAMQTEPFISPEILDSLNSRHSFFLSLNENRHTSTRKRPTLKACVHFISNTGLNGECSKSLTSFLPGPQGCLLPMPVLGCSLPVLLHISVLLLPQWCPLPRIPRILTSPLNHNS